MKSESACQPGCGEAGKLVSVWIKHLILISVCKMSASLEKC